MYIFKEAIEDGAQREKKCSTQEGGWEGPASCLYRMITSCTLIQSELLVVLHAAAAS